MAASRSGFRAGQESGRGTRLNRPTGCHLAAKQVFFHVNVSLCSLTHATKLQLKAWCSPAGALFTLHSRLQLQPGYCGIKFPSFVSCVLVNFKEVFNDFLFCRSNIFQCTLHREGLYWRFKMDSWFIYKELITELSLIKLIYVAEWCKCHFNGSYILTQVRIRMIWRGCDPPSFCSPPVLILLDNTPPPTA